VGRLIQTCTPLFFFFGDRYVGSLSEIQALERDNKLAPSADDVIKRDKLFEELQSHIITSAANTANELRKRREEEKSRRELQAKEAQTNAENYAKQLTSTLDIRAKEEIAVKESYNVKIQRELEQKRVEEEQAAKNKIIAMKQRIRQVQTEKKLKEQSERQNTKTPGSEIKQIADPAKRTVVKAVHKQYPVVPIQTLVRLAPEKIVDTASAVKELGVSVMKHSVLPTADADIREEDSAAAQLKNLKKRYVSNKTELQKEKLEKAQLQKQAESDLQHMVTVVKTDLANIQAMVNQQVAFLAQLQAMESTVRKTLGDVETMALKYAT